MSNRFSSRLGFGAIEKEIVIREDAPLGLRQFIVQEIYGLSYAPSYARGIICKTLRVAPDRSNWSEYPNIDIEVNQLIEECQWYFVYDIIEAFFQAIEEKHRNQFQDDVNVYFKQNGIGWKLENGLIEYRGDNRFESGLKEARQNLGEVGLQTAQMEISEAINDLSRMPDPDITGAIQHSLACLECVSRKVAGEPKATLGELIKKHPNIIPRPLDQAIEKMWGFASERGRHLREGQLPAFDEAELLVGIVATIATYLSKKLPQKDDDVQDLLPF
jgi:hypothetical protein